MFRSSADSGIISCVRISPGCCEKQLDSTRTAAARVCAALSLSVRVNASIPDACRNSGTHSLLLSPASLSSSPIDHGFPCMNLKISASASTTFLRVSEPLGSVLISVLSRVKYPVSEESAFRSVVMFVFTMWSTSAKATSSIKTAPAVSRTYCNLNVCLICSAISGSWNGTTSWSRVSFSRYSRWCTRETAGMSGSYSSIPKQWRMFSLLRSVSVISLHPKRSSDLAAVAMPPRVSSLCSGSHAQKRATNCSAYLCSHAHPAKPHIRPHAMSGAVPAMFSVVSSVGKSSIIMGEVADKSSSSSGSTRFARRRCAGGASTSSSSSSTTSSLSPFSASSSPWLWALFSLVSLFPPLRLPNRWTSSHSSSQPLSAWKLRAKSSIVSASYHTTRVFCWRWKCVSGSICAWRRTCRSSHGSSAITVIQRVFVLSPSPASSSGSSSSTRRFLHALVASSTDAASTVSLLSSKLKYKNPVPWSDHTHSSLSLYSFTRLVAFGRGTTPASAAAAPSWLSVCSVSSSFAVWSLLSSDVSIDLFQVNFRACGGLPSLRGCRAAE